MRFQKSWGFFRDLPRVLHYLRPYWKLAVTSGALLGLSVLGGLLVPWPLALLVDSVLGEEPLPSLLAPLLGSWDQKELLLFAVLLGLATTAFVNGVSVISEYVNTKLELSMVLDLRSDVFEHAQKLSLSFHDASSTGNLMYALTTEAAALGRVVTQLAPLIESVLMLVGMFAIAYRIDADLALLAMTVVPFVYYSTGYYTSRIEPSIYRVRRLEGEQISIAHEAMQMFRVIVSFGREGHEARRFRSQGEESRDARVRLTVHQTVFSLAVDVITAVGTALVLGFGAMHVLDDRLTVGELLVVMSYIAAVYKPLQQISGTLGSLQYELLNLRLALDLLDTEPEIVDAPDARPLAHSRGEVAFENVSFSYGGREGTLRDISFSVGAGQRLAIVGPTGAGKTTLVSLIPRFYDADAGRVLVDGEDVRGYTLKSLRSQISLVMQEPLLFSTSIRENIRYGRLEARDEDVVAAARAANAHDFIDALPAGYDTELGERGAQLSGGERQRIALARAFLKDAPILILDEPTSSIDSATEGVILDALDRLMVGRTTIVIAHRLSTIRTADVILVLDGGRLIEAGRHEELMRRRGLYYALHTAQAGSDGEPVRDGLLARLAHALDPEEGRRP